MSKAPITTWLKVERESVVSDLQRAAEQLDTADGELVLDFSSVSRIAPSAIREMEKLASAAHDKAVNVELRGVNIDVYKVLKLVRLAPRFSFLA